MKTNKFGKIDTEDIPSSAIEVPVKINDCGKIYETIWYAGLLSSLFEKGNGVVRPSVDMVMIDVTNSKDKKTENDDY